MIDVHAGDITSYYIWEGVAAIMIVTPDWRVEYQVQRGTTYWDKRNRFMD